MEGLPREEGTMVPFWTLMGLPTVLSPEILFYSLIPPTNPSIGTREERRGSEVTSTPLSGSVLGPYSKQGESDSPVSRLGTCWGHLAGPIHGRSSMLLYMGPFVYFF